MAWTRSFETTQKALVNFRRRHNVPARSKSKQEDGELLWLEFDLGTTLPQLAIGGIELKWAEADYA